MVDKYDQQSESAEHVNTRIALLDTRIRDTHIPDTLSAIR